MRNTEERTERILEKVKIKRSERSRRRKILVSLTASAAVLLAVNLVLFFPYTVGDYDISDYRGSEYYSLMNQIGEMTYFPEKTNNFERWNFLSATNMEPEGDAVGSPQGQAAPQRYEEVTNNQTQGVIEGDLFKRSSDYVYYLSRRPFTWITEEKDGKKVQTRREAAYLLRVYSIKHGVYHFVSELEIQPDPGYFLVFSDNDGLYLSEDCKTVTIVMDERASFSVPSLAPYTTVVNLDVSDPAAPKELQRTSVSGINTDSRTVGSNLFLFTRFYVGRSPDFSKPEEYLPQVGVLGEMSSLPMEDIFLPENASEPSYLLACSFDLNTLAVKDAVALFSYFESSVYVSEDNIFATRTKTEESKTEIPEATFEFSYRYTEIGKIGYDENGDLSLDGTATVPGIVRNQYSLDEYEGVLRVVTTSHDLCTSSSYAVSEDGTVSPEVERLLERRKDVDRVKCNLFCLNLSDLSLIASVEDFSDPDESVKSVRFSGDKLYVCTATGGYLDYNSTNWNDFDVDIGVMYCIDPVFEFDLSDYQNIKFADTGTIPGYSLSLIEFTDGMLLGIGYGKDGDTLKIELYRREGDKVISVTKFEREQCDFASDFKAYFIDAEHGLVGLGVENHRDSRETEYLLLRYDGTQFNEVGYSFELAGGTDSYSANLNLMRACYAEGYVYIFCESRANIIFIG